MIDFNDTRDYIPGETPGVLPGIKIIGFFPYETARIRGLKMPRAVAENIENKSPRTDNKVVLICEDTSRFGTSSFAVFCHDSGCVFGKWSEVIGYNCAPLTNK